MKAQMNDVCEMSGLDEIANSHESLSPQLVPSTFASTSGGTCSDVRTSAGSSPATCDMKTSSLVDDGKKYEALLRDETRRNLSVLEELEFEENVLFSQLMQSMQSIRSTISSLTTSVEHTGTYTNSVDNDLDKLEALAMELALRRDEREKSRLSLVQLHAEWERRMNQLGEHVDELRGENGRHRDFFNRRRRRIQGLTPCAFVSDNLIDSSNLSYSCQAPRKDERNSFNLCIDNELTVYDWIIDIGLLSDLNRGGWPVTFAPHMYKQLFSDKNIDDFTQHAPQHYDHGTLLIRDTSTAPIVAVVGHYDKGKTFTLNQITGACLPSSKKVSTKGMSFKHVRMDHGSNIIVLDTAGSHAPIHIVDSTSIVEKEATELFLLDVIFDLSDYFICVVNDFTSLDQRYLQRLTHSIQHSQKHVREVIVVHNLKDVCSFEVFQHTWTKHVLCVCTDGREMKTIVAAENRVTGRLEERPVMWFKTEYCRHIAIGNEDSELGLEFNPWAIALLRYWLKTMFIPPLQRNQRIVERVIDIAQTKLSAYFNDTIELCLVDNDAPFTKYVKRISSLSECDAGGGGLLLPHVHVDASASNGMMIVQSDSFHPSVDIIQTHHTYCIYLDVPGMTIHDFTLSRQNVTTIIKGFRPRLYDGDDDGVIQFDKRQRKYGDFTLTFQIPNSFNRRWSCVCVENGVFSIEYPRDLDEYDTTIIQR